MSNLTIFTKGDGYDIPENFILWKMEKEKLYGYHFYLLDQWYSESFFEVDSHLFSKEQERDVLNGILYNAIREREIIRKGGE